MEQDKITTQATSDTTDTELRFWINDTVMTPDGRGIVKRIEQLNGGKIGYTCVLERPYSIIDPYQDHRNYNYPPYSFGYTYTTEQLSAL